MSAVWTEEEKATLLRLWPTESARQIAKTLNKTRNAIIGQAHRMQIPSKEKPRAAIPASKDRTAYVNPVLVVSRPRKEVAPVLEAWSGNAVPMLDASYGQCRAIIGSTDARNEAVMVCGDPIVEGQSFSFCQYHLKRYTQAPYRRG